MPRKPHVAIMLRVPPELGARLQDVAQREHRSVTQQVIHVLEAWLAEDERERRRLAEERREHLAAEAPEEDQKDDGGDPRPVGSG